MASPKWHTALIRYEMRRTLATRARRAPFTVQSMGSVLIITPSSGSARRVTQAEFERSLPLLDGAGRAQLVEVTFNSSYIEAIVDDLHGRERMGERLTIESGGGPPGDSAEQREAEALILAELARELGVPLVPRRFNLDGGTWVTADGASDDPPVLVEVWAHQGVPKPAQKAKVIADALKLLWLDRVAFAGRARKILAISDTAAAAHFHGRAWIAVALRDLDIEVRVVVVPDAVREKIRQAQERQFR